MRGPGGGGHGRGEDGGGVHLPEAADPGGGHPGERPAAERPNQRRRLRGTPAFVIAKGGITSSDVGTRALGVRRATVLGQIRPGIPVWKTGPESKFPGVPYVIFPGNAGDEEDLRRAVEVFRS